MAVAKKKVKKKPVGGPFLAAAVFCDTILHGEDGVLSAIRIVDRASVTIPSKALRVSVATWALLMFKSGSAKGKHEVKLVIHSPSGKKTAALKHKLVFADSPNSGANLKIELSIEVAEGSGGLYMVDVLLDGRRVTRMPLFISVTCNEGTPSEPAKPKRATRAKPKRKAKRNRG